VLPGPSEFTQPEDVFAHVASDPGGGEERPRPRPLCLAPTGIEAPGTGLQADHEPGRVVDGVEGADDGGQRPPCTRPVDGVEEYVLVDAVGALPRR